jgi:molybdenum cofactor cytidylyltransferase
MISAILLAAGESSRMNGDFKPLMKWGTRSIISQCIDNLKRSRVDEIIVVLGHRQSEVRSRLAGAGVQFAINEDFRRGMISSIQTGLPLISPRTDGVMICLVDQPMVGPDVINPLVISFGDYEKKISVPTFHGKHGHPIIISREYETEIMKLSDDNPDGFKALLNNHRNEIQEVSVDSDSVLQDIDTFEDYQRLIADLPMLYESHSWTP